MRKAAEKVSRKQSEGFSALYAIAAAVSQSLDLNALLRMTLDRVLRVMDSEIGDIFLYDPGRQELSLAVHRGLWDEVIAKVGRQKVGKDEVGIASRTAYTKEVIIIDDLSQHPLAQYARDEVERGRLASIWTSGQHLLALINDLLDLSKVEVGKIELRPEPFPLWEALEATLELVRSQAVKKGLVLFLEAPSDLPLLSADPVRFKQILIQFAFERHQVHACEWHRDPCRDDRPRAVRGQDHRQG